VSHCTWNKISTPFPGFKALCDLVPAHLAGC
jgi:hypothetical protein